MTTHRARLVQSGNTVVVHVPAETRRQNDLQVGDEIEYTIIRAWKTSREAEEVNLGDQDE